MLSPHFHCLTFLWTSCTQAQTDPHPFDWLEEVNAIGGQNRTLEKIKDRQSKLFSVAKIAVSAVFEYNIHFCVLSLMSDNQW